MRLCLLASLFALLSGCATMKESDTARTGVEQLLISQATDHALDKVDLRPVAGAKVFVDTQYLDCVDKNYVIVSLHQRLMAIDCRLCDKADDADVVLEIASGAVGTDRHELFVGIPEIPLPPPSPIALPKLAVFNRAKAMGTAKFRVVAFDAKSHRAVINSDVALARSDYRHWSVIGSNSVASGTVPDELKKQTGESESALAFSHIARKQSTER
ncbi:MAG TPA: DUF6655 family protein [Pirellulales bacterium]|nr:DUF6655 family protein [Pirellulales bacterium]